MFQQSAQVAVETTVLSADVRRVVVNPPSLVACLPRWSSAPASLAAGAPVDLAAAAVDEPDTAATTSPSLEPGVRHKLRQMFSLDVGVLERPQQQQQQHLSGGDDDTVGTTRL